MKNNNITGVLNIYKEKDYTSHDVVAIIRKATGAKTGHTGTLDPQAEGVLPICLGRATKLAEYLSSADKTYVAQVVLGVTTDTGDLTGEVLMQQNVPFDRFAIDKAVASFKGSYMQTPPMYSAIKVQGKRLYELARAGHTVERVPRQVTISQIAILEYQPGESSFIIEVTCSKGTYIRSLCMDIGEKLGYGATMGTLIRTRSGMFSVEDSIRIATVKEIVTNGDLLTHIMSVEKILPFSRAYVKPDGLNRALNGNPISLDLVEFISPPTEGARYWLHGDNLIGLFAINMQPHKPPMLVSEVMF